MMATALINKPTRSGNPAFEPITLAEAKKQVELPAEYTAHDQHLSDLITYARESVEHDTGLVLATGTFTWRLADWPGEDAIPFSVRPVSSVTSITYTDSAGSTQTVATSVYAVKTASQPPCVVLKYDQSWPTNRGHYDDITITFVAGYANQLSVPRIAKQACLILVAREFQDRIGETRGEQDLAAYVRTYEMLIRKLQRYSYP